MTKEFKKITNKSETRYVLESMTAGATGSASIAAAPGRLGKLQKRLQELKDKVPQKPRQGPLRPQTGAGVHKNKKKDQQRGIEKHKGQSVYQEEFNGEYDDEAGMAESNLHTLARAVKGLMDTIDHNDNLPEWCQEKIAKAEMMLVSVWDYLLSQKEQGIDPEQGVDEGTNDSTQVLSDIVANEDFDALYDLMSSDTEAGKIVQRMYNDVSGEEGLHPDDDFEEILSIVLDRLTQDYGQQGVKESERTMSRAGKGVMKYGKDGMKALAKAGREGASEKKLDSIRDKYDNYTEGLRPGEYHIASVIFDNGTVKKIRVPSDNLPQSFFDRVKKNYEQQGLNVVDIKMDHGVHNSLAAEGGLNKGTGLRGELASFLKANGFKGPYPLGKLSKWSSHLPQFDKDTLIMVQGNDVKYDTFVADVGYNTLYVGAEEGITKMTKKAIINHIKQDMLEGNKIKGADGKACWKGYRYAGTKNGKDSCVKVGENDEYLSRLSEKLDISLGEKSKSQKQAATMAAAAHNLEFAKRVGISQQVAKEFNRADTGKDIKRLPVRVPKKQSKNKK
jgi:hypothetical protein